MSDVFGYFATALNLSCMLILLIICVCLSETPSHYEHEDNVR